MDALDNFSFFELSFGYATNAIGGKVRVPRLNAAQATQVLVALFFPLGYEVPVCDFVLDAILV